MSGKVRKLCPECGEAMYPTSKVCQQCRKRERAASKHRGWCLSCGVEIAPQSQYCKVCIRMTTICHPDRKHWCKGLCRPCFDSQPEQKARRLAHIQSVRLKEYNLTEEQFLEIQARQGGKCAACKIQFGPGRKQHIDHCHKTGQVRGLLCSQCNHALGLLGDNLETILALAMYIERSLSGRTLSSIYQIYPESSQLEAS